MTGRLRLDECGLTMTATETSVKHHGLVRVCMRTSKSAFVAATVAIFALASASSLGAQKVRLFGTVVDQSGGPVPNVELTLQRGNRAEGAARSGDAGQFDFGQVLPGTMLVIAQRLGYQRRSFEVNVDPQLTSQTVRVDLMTVPADIEKVVIEESSGRFHEFLDHRKASKFGHFFDQDQIRAKSPRWVSELFRTVPGARLAPTASGGSKLTLRGCRPKIWLDGTLAVDAEIDDLIPPSEIAGIEIYPSWAGVPAQYMDRENRACGTVLIWSKT
jgi:Carboxypeptidase regulatory-like domain